MAAFTTTSPASGYIINTLMAIAVAAMAGLAGSYLLADRNSPDPIAPAGHAGTATTNINPTASY